MQQSAPLDLQLPSAAWLRNAGAAGVALALHAIVLGLLLAQWSVNTPAAPQVRTLTTQLIAIAPPAPPAPQQPEVITPPAPLEPVQPVVAPTPDPRIEQHKLEQAALARKRVEQREIEQQRQRDHEQTQRREAEEQARQQQQAQQQQLAQQQAQQSQQAAAAERSRQAELAAAASRQHQPIAKEAPDYPDRALDKGIEGDCTVSYRVSPQGRVEDPQVVGDCHPLFVRPSLAAARTFRYQPRLIDGHAVAVPDVKNTFHYRIE